MDRETKQILIEIIQNQRDEARFSTDFLVVYGLRGRIRIMLGNKQYDLETGGLLTIAPFSYYAFHCDPDSGFALLHVTQTFLRNPDVDFRLQYVFCYCKDQAPGFQKEYDLIRKRYASLFALYFQETERKDLQIFTDTAQLLHDLSTWFSGPEPVMAIRGDSMVAERCIRIMNYIHANWRQNISIEQLAAREYVSGGYLSRFFKKYIGTTFGEYLLRLRLQSAKHDLETTADTITKIAYDNGFSNVNAFITGFRENYGTTPNQYRKRFREEVPQSLIREPIIPDSNGIERLLEYAAWNDRAHMKEELPAEARLIDVSVSGKGNDFRRTWQRILNIGYARNGLLAEVQHQISRAQEEIGFEYVRFHGILDDDMYLYHEDTERNPVLDFSRVDLLLDFLIESGLKPFLELSYIPEALSKNKVKIFARSSYISVYNHRENWQSLISGLIRHLISRYGREQIRAWRFSTIGCNCVTSGLVAEDEYLLLYETTRNCLKEIDGDLQFGGPGGWISSLWNSTFIKRFFAYSAEKDCVPDFACVQCFPHQSIRADEEFWQNTLHQTTTPEVLSADPHFMKHALEQYKALLEEMGLPELQIWVEEMNSTIWQRDISGDTCYKAAWLVQNACENDELPEAMGYWTLSDFIEESARFESVFHGGFGLMTYNGIPKSGYQAMLLLRMFGGKVIGNGDGWMITQNGSVVQILLYHYCHYESLYRMRYRRLTDPKKAYSVFEQHPARNYKIHLSGLLPGTYEQKCYRVSPDAGSAFDIWMRRGLSDNPDPGEAAYLRQAAIPGYERMRREIRGDFSLECPLEPHEVQLIILQME